MANEEHLAKLSLGVKAWNAWRKSVTYPPDLSGANLSFGHFPNINLKEADLTGAILYRANLSKANLIGAKLLRADLSQTNLTGANLTGATLALATLASTHLERATLKDCVIYGASVWNVSAKGREPIQPYSHRHL